MDDMALLLSRLQFAFTISFHIIFPAFSIGLAAWLTVLEALHLWTGRPAYRVLFDFWLKIFGVAFGLGVVSGIVMAFTVRHELERILADGGFNPRSAAFVRDIHSVRVGGRLLRRADFRPLARSPLVLSVFDRHGGVGHFAFRVLDHGE